MKKSFKVTLLVLISSFMISCSSVEKKVKVSNQEYIELQVEEDKNILFGKTDYLSPLNRRFYAFNCFADRTVIYPIMTTYDYYVPNFVQDRVKNFVSNFGDIRNTANLLLQFRILEAVESTFRFAINSTIGILGMFDVASEMGIKKYQESLGNTLAYYGVGEGFYIMAPLIGPTTLRDSIGMGAEGYGLAELDPYDVINIDVATIWFSTLVGFQMKKDANIYFGESDYIFEYEYLNYLSSKMREFNLQQAKNTRKNIF